MGSACNYCREKPGEKKLVQLDCRHHVCHSCVKLNGSTLQNGYITLTCKDCKQPASGNPSSIVPEPIKIKVRYGQQFYVFNIDATLTTKAQGIKDAFLKKMNREIIKDAKLKKQQIMLRVINQGFVFEDQFVFSFQENWQNLQIGLIPEINCI